MNDYISVTDVVEYCFCPYFTYFQHVNGLKQFESRRGTVMAGRNMHKNHESHNVKYVPKNLSGKKLIGLVLYSRNLGLVGKIDEAVELENEIILIERKYSDSQKITDSLKSQLGLLAILLEENLKKVVNKSFVIFDKFERKELEIIIDASMKKFALTCLKEVKNIVSNGVLPTSSFDNRCVDCCFRKICPVGSLNSP